MVDIVSRELDLSYWFYVNVSSCVHVSISWIILSFEWSSALDLSSFKVMSLVLFIIIIIYFHLTPQRYWQILFLVAFSGKIFYFDGLHISNLCTRSCLNSNDCHYLNWMGFELKKYISDFFKLGLYCQTSFKWLWSRLIEILEGKKSLFLGFRILNP